MGEQPSQSHVVHLTTVHPPADPRIYFKEVLTLAEAGYRVTLVAPGSPPPPAPNVQFHPLPIRKSRRQRMSRGVLDAAAALRRLPADLYHFHDPELLPLGGWLQMTGRRAIYDAHESLHASIHGKPYLRPAVARGMAWFAGTVERIVGGELAHVVAATPTIAEQFAFPTTVVANYPRLDEWQAVAPPDRESYGARPARGAYVGVITADRGRKEMMDAAAMVVQNRPEFELVLAGLVAPDPPPCGPGVRYAGILDRQGVVNTLAMARFGLVIMKPLPNHVAAWPTKFFEYMAAGLPVIVSRSLRGAACMTESEGCGLVVDGDGRSIAQAILRLLRDPDESFAMGQRGHAVAFERYSWTSQGDRLLQLYSELLGSG